MSKRVLITGASGMIGRALVARFLADGWHVIAQVRSRGTFDESDSLEVREFDLASSPAGELIASVAPLDLVINNAADQEILRISDREGALRQFLINAIAPAEIAGAARTSGVKTLINISSVEAQSAKAGHEYYGATKAALDSLTRSLANSLAPMRILGIRLGLVGDKSLSARWPEGVAAWQKATPASRFAAPEEVAEFVLLLSSDLLQYATGAIFDFDGGKGASPGW